MVLVGAGEGPRAESRQSSVEDISVPAGEAVDIFYRYGKQYMETLVIHQCAHWVKVAILP